MSIAVIPRADKKIQEEIRNGLTELLRRAENEEFETIMIIGINHEGAWLTKEIGKVPDRLVQIGLLKCLKTDCIQCTETNKPTGL